MGGQKCNVCMWLGPLLFSTKETCLLVGVFRCYSTVVFVNYFGCSGPLLSVVVV